MDRWGNLYIADEDNHRVRKVDPSGVITTVAGTGRSGSGGDGGPAADAGLAYPSGVAVDGLGNLYIADTWNHRVRRVDTSGVIKTVAGTGRSGSGGDGGPATGAGLAYPNGVAVDGLGNLYIADTDNHRVRRVDASGVITTVAGTGESGSGGDGGRATGAQLNDPKGVAVDGAGNLYIADEDNHQVRRVDRAGVITTVAGTGRYGSGGDGGPATGAGLGYPRGVAVDALGNLYIVEWANDRVRRVDRAGVITTVAGAGPSGSGGDGGPATDAQLNDPSGVAVDGAGNVYIADTDNHQVRRVDRAGVITTVAGTGAWRYGGDGGPATSAQLNQPGGVAVDGLGNLYIADSDNHRVRKVDPVGVVSTVAGTGVSGSDGDGGSATNARIARPADVAVDRAGNLYIADWISDRVRRVDASGVITTAAGTGRSGYGGDGGPATAAQLNNPNGVAVDGAGNVYIADTDNHRVRRVDASGVITTVAGTGRSGFGGDGGPATSAQLAEPGGVAVDGAGNVYIADTDNHRVRRVDTSGVITTVAGAGTAFGSGGDGDPATSAHVSFPADVAVDGAGNLYIAECITDRVRRVDASGVITTVAGTGRSGFGGDGGPATDAQLANPTGLAVDGAGNVYIADTDNHRARRLEVLGGGTTTTPLGVADDHGNDATNATQLSLGSSRDGNIATADDEDWFRLETSVPTNLRIRTTGGLDTVGTLFDASNRRVASNDDGGDGLNFALKATVEAGVYFVRVKSYGSATGSYTIHAEGSSASQLASLSSGYRIDTFAGSRERGDGGPATEAWLAGPSSVTVDAAGNTYIADTSNNRIRKVDAAGIITTIAGTGEECGWSGCLVGDGGPATKARLAEPSGVTVDGAGNLYIADSYNHRIRKVGPTGTITTVAGSGGTGEDGYGFSGDGGPAAEAELAHPTGVAVDAAGNLYIADTHNHRVRKLDAAGVITTVAGTGERGYSGDGGPATRARLSRPQGIAVDVSGNLYISDRYNHRIRKVDGAGIITTIVGTGRSGFSGDGGAATQAQLRDPSGVAVDVSGNLYVTDSDNHRIRKVDGAGIITTIVGTGRSGFSGDGGAATQAQLRDPSSVAVDAAGNLYIADASNDRIRRVDAAGVITTVAGAGEAGFSGDGGAATQAQLGYPSGVAADAAGNLYIADTSNNRIRRVNAAGVITTVAGAGKAGFAGDGGAATEAELASPTGMAVDAAGNLYIADTSNNRIRRVDPAGVITTVAGTGEGGYSGDGGAATQAQLDNPQGTAVDGAGNLYIADTGNQRIRKVDADGIITTVAGPGQEGIGGDGGAAVQAQLYIPRGVAVDGAGNLYIADTGNQRIRKVDQAGTITTVAGAREFFVEDGFESGGCRSCGFSGDGGPATQALLGDPSSVAVDGAGNLYIADSDNHRIRKVDSAGTIVTVAGTGESCGLFEGCFGGDGGPAVQAHLDTPVDVAVDRAGNIYIADSRNERIRKLTPVGGSGVTATPDLVVQAPSVGQGSIDAGASFTLRATVRNQGAGPSGATTLRYYRSSNVNISTSDTEVGTDSIGSLSASGFTAESVSLTAPSSAGTYYYGACVDPVPVESNTANNCSDGVRVTVSRSAGLAPADETAFNSLMVGNRIISQVLSVDFAAAGRLILSGRLLGSYSYSNSGSSTGTVTLTLDSGQVGIPSGYSLDLAFTFTSASSGGMTLAGYSFDWILDSISEAGGPPPPLFQDRSGSQLDFFIFDIFRREESRAYDVQIRRKTVPASRWQTGCIAADPPAPDDLNFRSFKLFATGVPQGTHQVRYRHRNSSRCGSGTPGEWSEIGEEGVTRWPW